VKRYYDFLYRHARAPWDLGPRRELVEVIESGRIGPCRAIDLGCGTASNAIFLAQHGFTVTGTDYWPAAARMKACPVPGRRRPGAAPTSSPR